MISIIVPVYNTADRLSRCIESILRQTDPDFELFLIDDGSSDDSFRICREYAAKDSRIHALTQDNQGVSATRNRGLSLASGKYVMFADSDDYLKETAVETLRRALEAEDADIAICGLLEIGPEGERCNLPSIEKTVSIRDLGREYPDIFHCYLVNAPVNKLYRREKIQTGFLPDVSMGEDLLFNLSYLRQCEKIAFVKEALYVYQCLDTGLVRKKRPDAIEIAERLYLASMEFRESVSLGAEAEKDISNIFLKFLFHGLSQCYSTPGKTGKDKKAVLKKWAGNAHVQNALAVAGMPERKQQVFQFLMKHHMLTLMHLMLCLWAGIKR